MSTRDACRLHAQTAAYRLRVAQTERLVATALERGSHPYVACSGGKDSTVLLDIVRRIAPQVDAIYGDDEWRLPETDTFLASIPNLRRIAQPHIQHAPWFTAHTGGPPANAEWIETTEALAAHLGYDLVFLGLRMDENVRRRILIRTRGMLFAHTHAPFWTCCPLAAWSVRDVWAYLLSRDIPYNAAYDVLERIGVPLQQQRIGPFAVERVLGRGQLAILKRGWPDVFNRFAARHPEARAYV